MVRVKHRYLLVNILYPEADASLKVSGPSDGTIVDFRRPSPPSLQAGHLIRHIRENVSFLFGDYGAGMTGAGLTIKYFSQATSTFILRCPRAHYRFVWSALTHMTELPTLEAKKAGSSRASSSHPCVMRVIRVSGTVRKSEEEAIRRARADILKAQRQVAADAGKTGNAGGTLGTLLAGSGGDAGRVEDVDMDDEGGSEDESSDFGSDE